MEISEPKLITRGANHNTSTSVGEKPTERTTLLCEYNRSSIITFLATVIDKYRNKELKCIDFIYASKQTYKIGEN